MVMRRVHQIHLSPTAVVVGLSLFASLHEAKLGNSHTNTDRKLEKHIQAYGATPSNFYPLEICEGDCDVDEHCKGGLVCFHREGFDTVPGCKGGNNDATPTDYCIDPNEKMSLSELKWYGKNPRGRDLPLQECEGDCDSDSDCARGLVCLQRRTENSGPVPGCWGKDNGLTDYCIKNAFLNQHLRAQSSSLIKSPTPKSPETKNASPSNGRFDVGLKLYWEPHYRWQEEKFDRRWCMECRDGRCNYGDKAYIHTCERAISQRYDFVFVDSNDAMIRLHGTDLCFERILFDIFLYDCNAKNHRQIWVGDFRRDRFEIKPFGLDSHCVTQRHHPKFYEEVEIEPCIMARHSDTSYWTYF